jgi:hypothetical protein
VSLDGAGELSVSGEYSSLPALYKSQIWNYVVINSDKLQWFHHPNLYDGILWTVMALQPAEHDIVTWNMFLSYD